MSWYWARDSENDMLMRCSSLTLPTTHRMLRSALQTLSGRWNQLGWLSPGCLVSQACTCKCKQSMIRTNISIQTLKDVLSSRLCLKKHAGKSCRSTSVLFGLPYLRRAAMSDVPAERTRFVRTMAQLLKVAEEEIRFVGLRDNLVARRAHNKTIPDGFHPNALRQVDQYATNEVLMLFRKDPKSTLSLTCGPLLKDVLGLMNKAIEQPLTTPKLKLYSAHDTTLMPLLLVLGSFDGKWPPFAADITLELYEDVNHPSKRFVKAMYCGKPVTMPKAEGEYLDYEVFEKSIRKLIPEDYLQACKADTTDGSKDDGTSF
eukprot:m.46395 g.46395  ORF g.46395 m.46395 type:complete len:316 (-) comp13147_c0_seq2:52-999(-)